MARKLERGRWGTDGRGHYLWIPYRQDLQNASKPGVKPLPSPPSELQLGYRKANAEKQSGQRTPQPLLLPGSTSREFLKGYTERWTQIQKEDAAFRANWKIGRDRALEEQKQGATKPTHWKHQPRDPDQWQGYRDEWVRFLKIRNKAFPSSGWSASKAQNMRPPHWHFVTNVKACVGGIAAGLLMVYASNFVTTRATVVQQTPASLVAPSVTPISIIVVAPTTVPSVTPANTPVAQNQFNVALVAQPGAGCTFDNKGGAIPNGSTIRFTSPVPATITMEEKVLNPWPLHLPAKKRSFEVNGSTVLKLHFSNHWLPIHPDIKFTCETPSVSGTAHGNPLHVYRSR